MAPPTIIQHPRTPRATTGSIRRAVTYSPNPHGLQRSPARSHGRWTRSRDAQQPPAARTVRNGLVELARLVEQPLEPDHLAGLAALRELWRAIAGRETRHGFRSRSRGPRAQFGRAYSEPTASDGDAGPRGGGYQQRRPRLRRDGPGEPPRRTIGRRRAIPKGQRCPFRANRFRLRIAHVFNKRHNIYFCGAWHHRPQRFDRGITIVKLFRLAGRSQLPGLRHEGAGHHRDAGRNSTAGRHGSARCGRHRRRCPEGGRSTTPCWG